MLYNMGAGVKKLNLFDGFQKVTDYFAPRIIGGVNDVFVKVARIKGNQSQGLIFRRMQDHAGRKQNHRPFRRGKFGHNQEH